MHKRKEQIINAAVDLMAVNGYKGTSLHNIAKQLSLSEPALYYYFDNKEQLLSTIIEQALDTALRKLNEVKEMSITPREKIHQIARMYAHLIVENRMMAIYFNNKNDLSPENLNHFTKNEYRFVSGIREVIAEALPASPEINPTVATFALIGMCSWLNRWVNLEGELSVDEIVDQFLLILDKGILRGG